MEELNNKLNTSNNIVRTRIISRIVQNIRDKYDKNPDLWEMKFLREQCLNANPAINELIFNAILHLIREGVIEIKAILNDFITVITTTPFPSNFVCLINQLLITDLKQILSNKSVYKSTFNLCLPQHPFITILIENSDYWQKIYNEIILCYQTETGDLLIHLNELYKPIFFYIICDPTRNNQNLLVLKQQLWSFLVNNSTIQQSNIIQEAIKWIQLSSINSMETNSRLLIEISKIIGENQRFLEPHLLILLQISSLHYLILNNYDPRMLILQIIKLLQNCNTQLEIIDVALLLISKTIPMCSSVYLSQLLTLTKVLLHQQPSNVIVRQILKSSLLQWISNSSILIADSIKIVRELLEFIDKNQTKSANNYKKLLKFWHTEEHILKIFNDEIYISIKLCLDIETWRNTHDLCDWLLKIEELPKYFLIKIINLLYGLFLCKFNDNDEINLKIFDILIKCSEDCKKINQELLTIILYKLTNSLNSELHVRLLKQLPKMANLKDNYIKVLNTIQALTKTTNSNLLCFSMELMFDLWKIDNKSTYPHLENLLINTKVINCEFLIIKARILSDLCALKPELYGKDMVAHLSKILNDFNDDKNVIACSIALDGIRQLCKNEIIDAITTWANLRPIFIKDQRKLIIKSLCNFITECPQLSYIESYQNLLDDLIKVLWDYLINYQDVDVWTYALNAMLTFNIDQITGQMPIIYQVDDSKTDKHHHQAGYCWINFINKSPQSLLPIIGDFFIKLLNIEISNYLKYVYQIKGVREPIDYSYLPTNSLVRIIGWFIKFKALKFQEINQNERLIIVELLRVFSQEYSKPLPPFDWCFLQEFIHEDDLKVYCINIAAHQVILSGTARRLIENYLIALTEYYTNDRDVVLIYRNLKHIANSIQPIVLKPFLQVTLLAVIETFKNDENYPVFIEIIDCLKETLDDTNIQDINKIVIAEIISTIIEELAVDSRLLELLLKCIIKFPQKQLDSLISAKTVGQLNVNWLKKSIKIRAKLALNSTKSPLNYLNELIDVGYDFSSLTGFMFEEFIKVFKKHRHNTESALWYLEFLGQTQALIADKGSQKQILYQCNILILSTIIFSGHFIFLKNPIDFRELFDLFPQAIVTLLDINHWSICTIMALEWLHFMYKNENFTQEYKEVFKQSLQALRHEHEFTKNMNWMKYINIEF